MLTPVAGSLMIDHIFRLYQDTVRRFVRERECRLHAKSQADRIGFSGANPVPDFQRMPFQCGKGFRPRFTAVNVGAVGEVEAVGEFHAPAHTTLRGKGASAGFTVPGVRCHLFSI